VTDALVSLRRQSVSCTAGAQFGAFSVQAVRTSPPLRRGTAGGDELPHRKTPRRILDELGDGLRLRNINRMAALDLDDG